MGWNPLPDKILHIDTEVTPVRKQNKVTITSEVVEKPRVIMVIVCVYVCVPVCMCVCMCVVCMCIYNVCNIVYVCCVSVCVYV